MRLWEIPTAGGPILQLPFALLLPKEALPNFRENHNKTLQHNG